MASQLYSTCRLATFLSCSNKMFTARKKIVKERGAEPDEFEESVAQVSSYLLDALY